MKLVTLFLLMSSINICLAKNVNGDMRIYQALAVEEVDTTEGRVGAVIMEKKVGGLKCVKSKAVYPRAPFTYNCTLEEKRNNKLIYNSLDIKETVPRSQRVGVMIHMKRIGKLTCSKSRVVSPSASNNYNCILND